MQEKPDIMKYFLNKYDGISLFHHFASETAIIDMIHHKYTNAKKEGALTDESIS